ncbi:DMT family transporter [Marispirochaeta aestuarii]|uniref:DMT family transporter n=1 Tax=Marispirochaeta aestuarii TaxID=1963862 RepID=UPI002ABD158B|nr:DMT family transporter [Marispirochaeta aestuarii]
MHIMLGQIFALLTAACWAHNSIVYSEAGKRVGSRAVTHVRLWIALPAMLAVHFIVLGRFFPTGFQVSVYLYLLLSGFFGFFIADLLIFKAFVDAGPRETLVIMTLSPIFAALFSWVVLGEVLSPLQILGILATVGGVIWVIIEEGARGWGVKSPEASRKRLGALFALGGAFTQALGMMLAKAGLVSGLHPVSGNLLRLAAGLAGLILYALIRGSFVRDFAAMKDRTALGLTASGAMIGPVLGIVLSLYALSWAPVGIVTALMQTSPILLLPLDHYVFKKRVTPGALAGTLVAVGGTILLFSL